MQNQDQNKQLSACIMHAIECETAFKLYSYRVIDPEQFALRILELSKLLRISAKAETATAAEKDNQTTILKKV